MEQKGYALTYHPLIARDMQNIDTAWGMRIRLALETKVAVQPELFGVTLRESLKGYRKLRVGDYRIVFRIEKRTVRVLAMLHRSVVYGEAEKRT